MFGKIVWVRKVLLLSLSHVIRRWWRCPWRVKRKDGSRGGMIKIMPVGQVFHA